MIDLRALLGLLLFPLAAWSNDAEKDDPETDYRRHAHRAVPRDAFPVLNDPKLLSVAAAEKALRDDDIVIGLVVNGEAQAFSVPVMGRHEILNGSCGGVPIAVTW